MQFTCVLLDWLAIAAVMRLSFGGSSARCSQPMIMLKRTSCKPVSLYHCIHISIPISQVKFVKKPSNAFEFIGVAEPSSDVPGSKLRA